MAKTKRRTKSRRGGVTPKDLRAARKRIEKSNRKQPNQSSSHHPPSQSRVAPIINKQVHHSRAVESEIARSANQYDMDRRSLDPTVKRDAHRNHNERVDHIIKQHSMMGRMSSAALGALSGVGSVGRAALSGVGRVGSTALSGVGRVGSTALSGVGRVGRAALGVGRAALSGVGSFLGVNATKKFQINGENPSPHILSQLLQGLSPHALDDVDWTHVTHVDKQGSDVWIYYHRLQCSGAAHDHGSVVRVVHAQGDQ